MANHKKLDGVGYSPATGKYYWKCGKCKATSSATSSKKDAQVYYDEHIQQHMLEQEAVEAQKEVRMTINTVSDFLYEHLEQIRIPRLMWSGELQTQVKEIVEKVITKQELPETIQVVIPLDRQLIQDIMYEADLVWTKNKQKKQKS